MGVDVHIVRFQLFHLQSAALFLYSFFHGIRYGWYRAYAVANPVVQCLLVAGGDGAGGDRLPVLYPGNGRQSERKDAVGAATIPGSQPDGDLAATDCFFGNGWLYLL